MHTTRLYVLVLVAVGCLMPVSVNAAYFELQEVVLHQASAITILTNTFYFPCNDQNCFGEFVESDSPGLLDIPAAVYVWDHVGTVYTGGNCLPPLKLVWI